MPALEKATLQELDNRNRPRADRPAVAVQFNPTSLRLQHLNHNSGGNTAGRQARQHLGTSSTTLTVELHFDTADEGTTDAPRSVLERTGAVQAFVTPHPAAGEADQTPPRVQFQWGQIIVRGVMESLSLDIDHFAHNGTPLRAKAAITIKEQNEEIERNRSGPGALRPDPALSGLLAGLSGMAAALAALPGARPPGLPRDGAVGALRQVAALAGESLAQVAQRSGLPPESWRALGEGIRENASRLPAGTPVSVPSTVPSTQPVGSQQGVQQGTGNAGSSNLLKGLTQALAGTDLQTLQRRHALSDAGGLGQAMNTLRRETAAQGSADARRAFAAPGGASRSEGRARTEGWGAGAPLREQVQVGHEARADLLSGRVPLRSGTAGTALPPSTSDPGVPRWQALRSGSNDLAAPPHPAGCRCGCGC